MRPESCGVNRFSPFFLLLTVAPFATSELAAQQAAPANIPNVINGCWDQAPTAKGKVCLSWAQKGDKFLQLGTPFLFDIERFDSAGVAISTETDKTVTKYSGTFGSNQTIQGKAEFTVKGLPAPPTTLPWAASYFSTPPNTSATGHHIFVACDQAVSIVDTGSHAVATANLNPGKLVTAIAVSPDGSTAYVSTSGDLAQAGQVYVIDGGKGAVARTMSLKDTPTPYGLNSVAVSGDGSILYGIGRDKSMVGFAIVALDIASDTTKATEPLPKTYTWNTNQSNPRIVVSGTSGVLDDGTPVVTGASGGNPSVFGSDSYGLATYPGGTYICSPSQGHVVTIGTKAVRPGPSCSAFSPDGTKAYSNGQELYDMDGTAATNPWFGAKVGNVWGSQVGVPSDGKAIFTLDGSSAMVYTIDPASSLTTDAIGVCEKPRFLGVEPLGAVKAIPAPNTVSSSPLPKPKGPAEVAARDPNRVVATMDGKPILAKQALDVLNLVPTQTRVQYRSRLAGLVEKLYREGFISIEAIALHLDQKPPWQAQLARTRIDILGGVMNYPGEPDKDLPPPLVAKWYLARASILWEAYFAQAPTPEAKDSLLKQKEAQYKLQIQVPEFFDAPNWF